LRDLEKSVESENERKQQINDELKEQAILKKKAEDVLLGLAAEFQVSFY